MPVRARIVAQRGEIESALELAGRAVAAAQLTDAVNRHAGALLDLGAVQALAGEPIQARASYAKALDLYTEKQNAVGAEQVHRLLADRALVRNT
jgi:hypothetical protein